MKNLRALIIVLFVVFAFASCEKSDVKPKCSHSSSTTEQQSSTDQNVSGRVRSSSPSSGTTLSNENINPNDIVGGGDDDRDGGDKKPKTVGK